MSFTVIPCAQRTPAWVTARLGRLTSSRAADMLAVIKSGEAASRRNLRVQLVLERLTGRSQERAYLSQAMIDGIEREAEARGWYEALTGRLLTETGFLSHDGALAGCSLDGHVGYFEGIVEIKAPIAATHLEYLKTGVVPGEYQKQITHALWISGARWCDWLTYQPDFPEEMQVRIVRVQRDEAAIAEYERKALAFLAEVERELDAILTTNNLADRLAAAVGVA